MVIYSLLRKTLQAVNQGTLLLRLELTCMDYSLLQENPGMCQRKGDHHFTTV